MARLFKPTYPKRRTVNGERVVVRRNGKIVYKESRKHYIEYRDAQGVIRRVPGYTDKVATEQLAQQLEREVAREQVGIVDVAHEHLKAPIGRHIADWLADLTRTARSSSYVRNLKTRVERLRADLGWIALTSIQPDSLTKWLGLQIGQSLSQRTANHYLEAVNAFCNWCVSQRRMERNPIGEVSKIEITELSVKRRSLTIEEIGRLLAVSGPRELVYKVALLTGLRRNELRLLQWGDVYLNAGPRIELRSETTKSRRGDSIPLAPQLVPDLMVIRPEDGDRTKPVFRSIPKRETFDRDLKRAGIPKVDDRGWTIDFHSLRKTYGTLLATSGSSLRESMLLMRHTDARLTTQIYTDPRLLDTAKAISNLPELGPSDQPESQRALKTGTYDAGADAAISECISESLTPDGIPGHSVAFSDSADPCSQLNEKRPEAVPGDASERHSMSSDSVKNRPEKLEAAGIEPASRDMSGRVSTCVVRQLNLETASAGEQASAVSSSTDSSQRAAEQYTLPACWVSSGSR